MFALAGLDSGMVQGLKEMGPESSQNQSGEAAWTNPAGETARREIGGKYMLTVPASKEWNIVPSRNDLHIPVPVWLRQTARRTRGTSAPRTIQMLPGIPPKGSALIAPAVSLQLRCGWRRQSKAGKVDSSVTAAFVAPPNDNCLTPGCRDSWG